MERQKMYEYNIEGGFPVKGQIRASGNKNAALPCIAAALLTQEPVILRNIPEIEDVQVMTAIFSELGGKVEKLERNTFKLTMADKPASTVPAQLSSKIRASILFAGPLLARTGRVVLPPPGGDVIGRRRLDTHFLALSELGAQYEVDTQISFSANKLMGQDIFLDEASVTATENAVMAAVLAEGETIISNAACEPHVQDLCRMLNGMGAKISGIGSNTIYIEGVPELHGTDYLIGPDYMEIGSFIGLAAVTHGSLTITDIAPRDMRAIKLSFAKLGIRWEIDGTTLTVSAQQELKVNCDIGGMIPKIDDAPWPGFPPDLTSIMTVVATQVEGMALIHEKMFDPHRAVVYGPSVLHGADLVSPDVRAGMAMVIAALCARGESRIRNVYQIERGYEDLTRRLQSLGAHIERISS